MIRREWTELDEQCAREGAAIKTMRRIGRSAFQGPKKKKFRGGPKDRARRTLLTGYGHEQDAKAEEARKAKEEEAARKKAQLSEEKQRFDDMMDMIDAMEAWLED